MPRKTLGARLREAILAVGPHSSASGLNRALGENREPSLFHPVTQDCLACFLEPPQASNIHETARELSLIFGVGRACQAAAVAGWRSVCLAMFSFSMMRLPPR